MTASSRPDFAGSLRAAHTKDSRRRIRKSEAIPRCSLHVTILAFRADIWFISFMPGIDPSLRRALILSSLIAGGFATGYMVRPGAPSTPVTADSTSEPPARPDRGRAEAGDNARGAPVPVAAPADLVSSDSIDDLLAAPKDELYARLALWLVDASSAEMHDFFRQFIDHPNATTRHFDLLFVRWAATDPMGAIQAAEGTPHAHIPWWGWAKNEPLAAFRHAMEKDRASVEWVVRSIGQNNPELALSLLAQHPELPKGTGQSGIAHGLTRDDPEAALRIALENGNYHDSKPLESWLRDDPHAAFQWFIKNRSHYPDHYSHDDTIIRSLARENPAALAELAATSPPGDLRRKMEAAVFEQLAATDPAKALAEARANPSPLIARERLAKLGVLQLESNPRAARAIFDELLALNPDPVARSIVTHYPGGSQSHSGESLPEVAQMLGTFAKQDPEGLITALQPAVGPPIWNQTSTIVATQWADNDPAAFASWIRRQTDENFQRHSAGILMNQLSQASDFQGALSHLDLIPEGSRPSAASNVVHRWQRIDPQAARAWVEDAGMMESMKHYFENQ